MEIVETVASNGRRMYFQIVNGKKLRISASKAIALAKTEEETREYKVQLICPVKYQEVCSCYAKNDKEAAEEAATWIITKELKEAEAKSIVMYRSVNGAPTSGTIWQVWGTPAKIQVEEVSF